VKIDWSRESLTVAAVTDSWVNRSVRPNPEYQRGLQWKRRQQQLLIDSIFRGYPLPRFYFELRRTTDPLGTDVSTLDVQDPNRVRERSDAEVRPVGIRRA